MPALWLGAGLALVPRVLAGQPQLGPRCCQGRRQGGGGRLGARRVAAAQPGLRGCWLLWTGLGAIFGWRLQMGRSRGQDPGGLPAHLPGCTILSAGPAALCPPLARTLWLSSLAHA